MTTEQILYRWDDAKLIELFGYPEPRSIQYWADYSYEEFELALSQLAQAIKDKTIKRQNGDSELVCVSKYLTFTLKNVRPLLQIAGGIEAFKQRRAAKKHIVIQAKEKPAKMAISPGVIHWLWQDRIPFGKLTLFTGHPGVGKGLATLDIAARASTGGGWVDCKNTNPPVEVLILSDKHAANSILARLMAAGADLSKILIVDTNDTNDTNTPKYDPLALKNCLEANPDVKLVIIDPVKGDLKPLAGIAEKYGVAIILVAHIKKNSGIPYVCDVIGMVGAVRVAWSFGEDKLDGKMKMIPLKAQGSRDMQLSYSIVGQDVEINGEFCSIGKIQWDAGLVPLYKQCMDWLVEHLSDGEPHLKTDIAASAYAMGYKSDTLKSASQKLEGRVIRFQNSDGFWFWQLVA